MTDNNNYKYKDKKGNCGYSESRKRNISIHKCNDNNENDQVNIPTDIAIKVVI